MNCSLEWIRALSHKPPGVELTFAQFEREVIGERVRDKIAASKRKSLWVEATL